jgi:hypothetical protein
LEITKCRKGDRVTLTEKRIWWFVFCLRVLILFWKSSILARWKKKKIKWLTIKRRSIFNGWNKRNGWVPI